MSARGRNWWGMAFGRQDEVGNIVVIDALVCALSRFQNTGGTTAGAVGIAASADQDSGMNALDNARPNRYFGPAVLDRTHQLSFGGYAELPARFQLGLIAHFWSPLSTSLVVPATTLGGGEIFRTDFTGDGTVQDLVPGTRFGSFDRDIDASNLNRYSPITTMQLLCTSPPPGRCWFKMGCLHLRN